MIFFLLLFFIINNSYCNEIVSVLTSDQHLLEIPQETVFRFATLKNAFESTQDRSDPTPLMNVTKDQMNLSVKIINAETKNEVVKYLDKERLSLKDLVFFGTNFLDFLNAQDAPETFSVTKTVTKHIAHALLSPQNRNNLFAHYINVQNIITQQTSPFFLKNYIEENPQKWFPLDIKEVKLYDTHSKLRNEWPTEPPFDADNNFLTTQRRWNRKITYTLDLNTCQELSSINYASSTSRKILLSPDNTFIISQESKGFKIIDKETGEVTQSVFSDEWICWLEISPDSRMIALSTGNSKTTILNKETGKTIQTVHHENNVAKLLFSNNSSYIALITYDANLIIINTQTNQIHTISNVTSSSPLCFSPDSQYLITSKNYREANIINLETNETLHSFLYDKSITNTIFSPNGSYAGIASSYGKTIKIFDVINKREIHTINTQKEIDHIAFTHNSNYLITSLHDKINKKFLYQIIDIKTGTTLHTITITDISILNWLDHDTNNITVDESDKWVAITIHKQTVILDIESGKILYQTDNLNRPFNKHCLSNKSLYLALMMNTYEYNTRVIRFYSPEHLRFLNQDNITRDMIIEQLKKDSANDRFFKQFFESKV